MDHMGQAMGSWPLTMKTWTWSWTWMISSLPRPLLSHLEGLTDSEKLKDIILENQYWTGLHGEQQLEA